MTRPSPEADFGVPSVSPATPTANNSRNNDSLDALVSQNFDAAAGARPTYILKGGTWAFDNGASPQEIEVYFFDGTEDILLYTIDVSGNTVTYPAIANTAFLNVAQTFTKTQTWSKGIDVVSATALGLGDDGNYFDITGTTTINTIDTIGIGTTVKLHFDAALTLTHNATDLILPGGANITTAAGDEFEFTEYATGDWRCTGYALASGEALVSASIAGWDFTSAEQSLTSGTKLTIAHSLGSIPTKGELILRCKTAESNWVVGNEIVLGTIVDASTSQGQILSVDASDIFITQGSDAQWNNILDKNSGTTFNLTEANWRYEARVSL